MKYILISIDKMNNSNDYNSPMRTYIGTGDDVKKIQGQMPSAVRTPPPPKTSK